MVNHKAIQIAINHLHQARKELQECSTHISQTLEELLKKEKGEEKEEVLQTLSTLQLEDIITQRLQKIEDFLLHLDKEDLSKLTKEYLEQFAWENEMEQDSIDKMFSQKG